jgi:hypothetical protein
LAALLFVCFLDGVFSTGVATGASTEVGTGSTLDSVVFFDLGVAFFEVVLVLVSDATGGTVVTCASDTDVVTGAAATAGDATGAGTDAGSVDFGALFEPTLTLDEVVGAVGSATLCVDFFCPGIGI